MSEPLPGGSDGKESACSAGDWGQIPGLGRPSWRRERYLGNHGRSGNWCPSALDGTERPSRQLRPGPRASKPHPPPVQSHSAAPRHLWELGEGASLKFSASVEKAMCTHSCLCLPSSFLRIQPKGNLPSPQEAACCCSPLLSPSFLFASSLHLAALRL